jgi:hypothetical protein
LGPGDRYRLEFIEHIGNTDALGTVLLTLVTAEAIPEHPGAEDHIPESHANGMHDLMG